MNITSGVIKSPQKVIVYGVEGIGKSTFVSQFPDPIFIDTEGSTKHLNVRRFDKPTSWEMLKEQVKYVINNKPCKTLCIDTADWAERLCMEHVCKKANKNNIEDFGYGNGFTYMNEEFGRLLNLLDDVIAAGINVAITAHAQLIKFEQPDEAGAYDRYELKLGVRKTEKRTAALLKEWADTVLFANYKTVVVSADDKGKKHKAYGDERVMYTAHHPCWDAKNRYGLPSECKFEYAEIAPHIPSGITASKIVPSTDFETILDDDDEEPTTPIQAPTQNAINIPSGVPAALADLMRVNSVSEAEIRQAVSQKGYFPIDTPITSYPNDFIEGCLIAAWEQVFQIIKSNRPF